MKAVTYQSSQPFHSGKVFPVKLEKSIVFAHSIPGKMEWWSVLFVKPIHMLTVTGLQTSLFNIFVVHASQKQIARVLTLRLVILLKNKIRLVFKLIVRRTLSSILKEEYKSSQPGHELGEIFLQLRFGMSSSYSNKILFFLVKQGFVTFFNRFSADKDRIISFLHGPSHNSGFLTSETK